MQESTKVSRIHGEKKKKEEHKSLIKTFRSKGFSTLYNTTKVAQCAKSSNSMNEKDVSKFQDLKDSCMLVENTRILGILVFYFLNPNL
jgi:hypothetical protein